MIETIRYCDICGKEIYKTSGLYYQLHLPETGYNGSIELSEEKRDVCKKCFEELYWKIIEIRHPNRKCPD